MIDTIYEWENQIVNSFIISDELGGNITNGIVEAKNNVAKTIIKSSYGKNDFKKFRKQFLESERTRKVRRLKNHSLSIWQISSSYHELLFILMSQNPTKLWRASFFM